MSARACFVCFEEKAKIVFIFTTGDQNLCCLLMDFLVFIFNIKIVEHFMGSSVQSIMNLKMLSLERSSMPYIPPYYTVLGFSRNREFINRQLHILRSPEAFTG